MEKRTLYAEIEAVDALAQLIKLKLRSEVVRGEVMELVLLTADMVTIMKNNFRDYPEVVDVFDGEGEQYDE
jgi:hypothetical protein